MVAYGFLCHSSKIEEEQRQVQIELKGKWSWCVLVMNNQVDQGRGLLRLAFLIGLLLQRNLQHSTLFILSAANIQLYWRQRPYDSFRLRTKLRMENKNKCLRGSF